MELNEVGAVIRALPHLARPSDKIAREVLAFLCIMLFNANEKIQVFSIRKQIVALLEGDIYFLKISKS